MRPSCLSVGDCLNGRPLGGSVTGVGPAFYDSCQAAVDWVWPCGGGGLELARLASSCEAHLKRRRALHYDRRTIC